MMQSLKLAFGSETELPAIMRNENFISLMSSATPFIILVLCVLPSIQRLHDLNISIAANGLYYYLQFLSLI